jgi:wobble nucleotide-excising tRNase
MINKIDINNFALFNNFSWDNSIGKNVAFKTVNIIYGRNYAGKTTLSRIFRCVEKGEVHQHYSSADFSISTNNKSLTQHNLNSVPDDINIRVYNTDFVKDNLSWLHNDDGKITPFALVGSINIELDKKIQDINEKLGKEEDKNGLHFELSEKIAIHKKTQGRLENKERALDKELGNKAKLIKENTSLFDVPVYNIISIRKDIKKTTESSKLSDEAINEKKNLLKEESKRDINKLPEYISKFSAFYEKTNNLLTKNIKPSQTITDLISDSILQDWVWQGINKHKNKRDSCGFCGNPLSTDLWEKLDSHFNEESKTLRTNIEAQIKLLETAKHSINNYHQIPNKENFYASLHVKCDNLHKQWQEIKISYSNNISHLIEELQEREKDIFAARNAIEVNDLSENIAILFKEFNKLIEEHNRKSSTLNIDQQNARNDLRLSEIATFLQTTNHQDKVKEIDQLKKETADLDDAKSKRKKLLIR